MVEEVKISVPMKWPNNKLAPVERYLYQGEDVRIGKFDCRNDHDCFPITESVADNMFVLATRPVWIRRATRSFQYVSPGSVLFHTAGCSIERKRDQTDRDLAFWFSIEPHIFEEAISSHGLRGSVPHHGLSSNPSMQLKFASILNGVDREQLSPLAIECQVHALLDEVCREAAAGSGKGFVVRSSSRAKALRLVDDARAYIDENLASDMDLVTIASEVGLSAFYLCRLFKSVCGVTIHEYRIRQRLSFVLDRLSEGKGDDLARLAMDSGFSSHSHLTRTFSRRYGMPPSSYRRFAKGSDAIAWS